MQKYLYKGTAGLHSLPSDSEVVQSLVSQELLVANFETIENITKNTKK